MSAPTDLELMLLLDDELPGDRRTEVEAFLASAEGAAARGKLAGLRTVSRVLAEEGSWPAWRGAGDGAGRADVADDVMRLLEGSEASTTPRPVERSIAPEAPAREEPREKSAGGRAPAPAGGGSAANDNGRLIFGLALAAAAAAAALFFWGKSPEPESPVARTAPALEPVAGEPSAAPSPAETAKVALDAEPAGDPRYGVEVASVDFGSRSGAIYYVPSSGDGSAASGSAAAAAVTTVVWLSDD